MSDVSLTLRAGLDYDPVPLKFGTSGRRGLVADLTQLEVYINAFAELEYLQSLAEPEGGIVRGDEFFYACDLRPSSSKVEMGKQPRGGLAQAIALAIADSGLIPVFLGRIPTPALTNYALCRGKGSMMVTGSHIPYDRNGYKTNSAKGELLKRDEAPIQARVEQVRARLYAQPLSASRFGSNGMLKHSSSHLPRTHAEAAKEYLRRYTDFFAGRTLQGLRLLVYQHSAVGRDLLVELLGRFGAEVIPVGRSETFVPIDTEAIDEEQLRVIESLAAEAWKKHGRLDAVVSTDGDSDRPLILGVEPVQERHEGNSCRVRFFSGDLVGMVVAESLGADAVVVPISCNDALDRGPLKNVVRPRTRIGSPFVIAGMQEACKEGFRAVCGWEANGGFLLGSDISHHGRVLKALPTRDAFLPILVVLLRASELGHSVSALFDRLPPRFSRASLLRNFPRARSQQIIARFTPSDESIREVSFQDGRTTVWATAVQEIPEARAAAPAAEAIRNDLEHIFNPSLGFDHVVRLNFIDGVRIYFSNGDVAHIRPSGNADELRIYALADSQSRADAIVQCSVAEPDGILRQLEQESTHSLN